MEPLQSPKKIIRIRSVIKKTGASRSSIHRWVAAKVFPAPVKMGLNSSGWIESEIDAWINLRLEERNNALECNKKSKAGK